MTRSPEEAQPFADRLVKGAPYPQGAWNSHAYNGYEHGLSAVEAVTLATASVRSLPGFSEFEPVYLKGLLNL